MRALTVRQPWAESIVRLGKDVENRSKNIAGSYRGPVAIHAGLTGDPSAYDHHEFQVVTRIATSWGKYRPHDDRGALVGVVDLTGVHEAKNCEIRDEHGSFTDCCSPWAMRGHWHLTLDNPRPLPDPIPYRGRLGLWHLPDSVVDRIGHQLGTAGLVDGGVTG